MPTNFERLKGMTTEEMARAICYKGLGCGQEYPIAKEGSPFFEREVERWIKWLNGTDRRAIGLWEGETE